MKITGIGFSEQIVWTASIPEPGFNYRDIERSEAALSKHLLDRDGDQVVVLDN
jgi:hypothetical protein